MCGIWSRFARSTAGDHPNYEAQIYTRASSIKHRGPDEETFLKFKFSTAQTAVDGEFTYATLGFNRLQVVGGHSGHQPFLKDDVYCICNGEIYNYKKLRTIYKMETVTESDCEVILHLYLYYTSEKGLAQEDAVSRLLELLDGVFSFVILDRRTGHVFAARDRYGVRPLFMLHDKWAETCEFASEIKSFIYTTRNNSASFIKEIMGGEFVSVDPALSVKTVKWYTIPTHLDEYKMPKFTKQIRGETDAPLKWVSPTVPKNTFADVRERIRTLLYNAVVKRVDQGNLERLGFFLSGGLDSSLILSVAMDYLSRLHIASVRKGGRGLTDMTFNVFTIGTSEESPDVQSAKKVVEYIRKKYDYIGKKHHPMASLKHHIVKFTPEEGVAAIPSVVRSVETFDQTTIRASVPQWLLSKYISENTNVVQIMSGEGADEVFGGYLYSHYAPSAAELSDDCTRLIKELPLFDLRRADRTTAAHSLELRAPFLDQQLVEYVSTLNPEHRFLQYGPECPDLFKTEKTILRASMKDYLPRDLLWLQKNGMSDAVGYDWKTSIKDHALAYAKRIGKELTPIEAENSLYKDWFETHFGIGLDHMCPHMWMPNPNWVESGGDSSATVLSMHSKNKN